MGLKEYAKTIGAFVAGVIANMISDLIEGRAPWPETPNDWLRYILTSLGAALGAFALRNKVTESQVAKGIEKGDVSPEVVKAITETAPAPVPAVVGVPTSDLIEELIAQAQKEDDDS